MMQPASMLIALVILASVPGSIRSQESEHAQPPAEAQVAQEFKAAAPELFRKWVEARSEQLRNRGRGELANLICTIDRTSFLSLLAGPDQWSMLFLEFLECKDSTIPTEYKIDVRRTDSVLTPFEGLIIVPVQMICTINGANPNAATKKKKAEWIAACVGVSYDQCLGAGVKENNLLARTKCRVEGLGLQLAAPYSYQGVEYISYGWTERGWELQEQHEEPALRSSLRPTR